MHALNTACLDIGHLCCCGITHHHLLDAHNHITSVSAERWHCHDRETSQWVRREPGISCTNTFTVNIFYRVWPHTKSFKEHVMDHMPMRTHCIYISDFLKEYQNENRRRPLVRLILLYLWPGPRDPNNIGGQIIGIHNFVCLFVFTNKIKTNPKI